MRAAARPWVTAGQPAAHPREDQARPLAPSASSTALEQKIVLEAVAAAATVDTSLFEAIASALECDRDAHEAGRGSRTGSR